ncbi:DUF6308 family protein [Streptomyces platensis]|uniref:DUF6308 family protein n=1 Tax=Streptomyces platensis TaxID=58346 RepID=UPI00225ADCBE|nr:DUF6308 family protein [Streptomyces platensis]MCX4639088.1 DUF6308 family protein [Streptomyces platensis]MCX4640372.1 DUF6308 family protein [Streptomyces platensis]
MSSADFSRPFLERLHALVADARAIVDLRGGGDRPEIADRITAEDLVAVETLSVTVRVSVTLDILEAASARRCLVC